MSDTPKRRGRPPKVLAVTADADAPTFQGIPVPLKPFDPLSGSSASGGWGFTVCEPRPLARFRRKGGVLQRAWQHPTGTQWRDVPAVADDAPDWEDSP